MSEPSFICQIRKIIAANGTDDLSASQLDAGIEWANKNDPELASILDDEVDFRRAGL